MLGLLKKLLPIKKEISALSGRDLHGRNNVGYPTIQISREIDNVVRTQYKAIRPIINLYKDTLFFKWGPSVINDQLTDEQLANLSGRNLQMVYLLLFRDMLRYLSELVTLKNVPENWPEVFAQTVLDNCRMLCDADDNDIAKKQQLFAKTERYAVDVSIDEKNFDNTEIPNCAVPIAELIMIPSDMIYKCHRPLITAIQKRNKHS